MIKNFKLPQPRGTLGDTLAKYNVVSYMGSGTKKRHWVKTKEIRTEYELWLIIIMYQYRFTEV